MIEIIYSDNKEEKITGFPVKLPRNVRQVGSGDDSRKIYIEDYVITYIRKLWEQKGKEYQAGVLLGSCKKYGGEIYLFISGAVRAEQIEREGNHLLFTDKVWTTLYEKIKQYFNNLEIVGWFYARNDSAKEIDANLYKTHTDNFGGMDKVLFLIDREEKEEEFYAYEDKQLTGIRGYYVYYEKNEAMQEYMVEETKGESVDEENDDRATTNYRLLVQEKQDTNTRKKLSGTLYTACTCLVIAILAAGTVLVRDYDRIQMLENQVQQLAVSVLSQNTGQIDIETVEGDVYPTTEAIEIENIEQTQESSEIPEQTTEEESAIETTTVEVETTSILETTTIPETSQIIETTSAFAGSYHIVEKGETLTSISVAVYQTDQMVSKIKEANGIEDGDKIYPGEEIYLP